MSDEERQRAIEELRRHCAAGRIDVDEYACRIERALSATTLAELDEVRADLPMLRIADPGGHGIWAGGRARSVSLRKADKDAGSAGAATGAGPVERAGALAVALIAVAVVLAAIVISLAFEWTWAVVLLAAWAAGLVQGRLGRRAKRGG